MRPIFAAYNTPSFSLAKCLVPIFTPLTTNEYTVTNSYSFVKKITKFSSDAAAAAAAADKYFMVSFDVKSLLKFII